MKDSLTKHSQADTANDSNHDLLMKFLQHPEMLRQKLENFFDEEKVIFGDSMNEMNKLSSYVVSNWRQIVPPVVAFGLSILLKQTEVINKASPVNGEEETLLN